MKRKFRVIMDKWKRIKTSSTFHNLVIFFLFLIISAVLWFIFALNDNVHHTYNVGLRIVNVPDSVTFIDEAPTRFKVSVNDRGTSLLRHTAFKQLEIVINFSDYSTNGIFKLNKQDLYTFIRNIFGKDAQITSSSIDSLSLSYFTGQGKRVPIDVISDVTAASGYVISGNPKLSITSVVVYSNKINLDTLHKIYTEKIIKRDLKETTTYKVSLEKIMGTRIVPNSLDVTFQVEPLVKKQSKVDVIAQNVPEGESILFFPSKVEISYFVPMSKFDEQDVNIIVVANYQNNMKNVHSGKIGIEVSKYPSWCENVVLNTDSVEYTIVR